MSTNDPTRVMKAVDDWLSRNEQRRAQDKQRFEQHDHDLCMICHAYGQDKRSLWIDCFYAINEVLPEALDISSAGLTGAHSRGYFICICKSCRGRLLGHLQAWRDEGVALRDTPKDHDGEPEYFDTDRHIPMRVHGTTVIMNQSEYDAYTAAHPHKEEA